MDEEQLAGGAQLAEQAVRAGDERAGPDAGPGEARETRRERQRDEPAAGRGRHLDDPLVEGVDQLLMRIELVRR